MIKVPDAGRNTEAFWHCATGAVLSWTVMVAPQVEVFEWMSVTSNTTGFGPMLLQLNADGVTITEAIPHESHELLSTCATARITLPVMSS